MIFGKSISEYVQFAKPILMAIVIIGGLRLVLSLVGMDYAIVQLLSVTTMGFIGLVYYAVRVHTSGFGSYKQLLPLLAIQFWTISAIVVLGILIAMATGVDNIYSAPEFTVDPASGQRGVEGKTWGHVFGHAVVAPLVLTLAGWAIASVILLVTKKVKPAPAAA